MPPRHPKRRALLAGVLLFFVTTPAGRAQPQESEGDFILRSYTFRSGATLSNVRLHYRTIGVPKRDASGKIRNAVLVMHGSSGDASQVLTPSMRDPLVGPGKALDPAEHFLIYPDILGAGQSTKPSDGLKSAFPRYGSEDLVDLEYRLVKDHFGIERLRLILGISMGGMHTWLWGIRHPEMMDGLMPISSLPTKIEGRNLLWRRILVHAIRTDPAWNNGNYITPPRGFLNIMPMFDMLVQSPARLAERLSTAAQADAAIADVEEETLDEDDANNILFRFESSFDYDPAPHLDRIQAQVLAVLFADDELNPPELGVIGALIAKVPQGKYVLVPASADTEGHRTQVKASVWAHHVESFVASLPILPTLTPSTFPPPGR